MDRLHLMPGLLFLTADVLAIVSLAMPYWIVTKVGGDTSLGLIQTCFTLSGRDKTCFSALLAPEWFITLILVMLGIVFTTATITLLFVAQSRPILVVYARWLGFLAMVMFCLAAVLFPLGFSMSEIGGEPYQLPNGYDVGIAYIAFILAVWVTVVSELFAGKFCPPRII